MNWVIPPGRFTDNVLVEYAIEYEVKEPGGYQIPKRAWRRISDVKVGQLIRVRYQWANTKHMVGTWAPHLREPYFLRGAWHDSVEGPE